MYYFLHLFLAQLPYARTMVTLTLPCRCHRDCVLTHIFRHERHLALLCCLAKDEYPLFGGGIKLLSLRWNIMRGTHMHLKKHESGWPCLVVVKEAIYETHGQQGCG